MLVDHCLSDGASDNASDTMMTDVAASILLASMVIPSPSSSTPGLIQSIIDYGLAQGMRKKDFLAIKAAAKCLQMFPSNLAGAGSIVVAETNRVFRGSVPILQDIILGEWCGDGLDDTR